MNNELIKLITDNYHGKVEKFSTVEANKMIRDELIALNGGSTKLNIKAFRRNPEMFDVIETVVKREVEDSLKNIPFFTMLVDEQNLSEGDAGLWTVSKNGALAVVPVARGTQSLRRQRIAEDGTLKVEPTPYAISVYDELTRVLAGKIDMNEMLDLIIKAVKDKRYEMCYDVLDALSSTELGSSYVFSGTYAESSVLDVCNHVSAANSGSKVVIYGSQKALRKLTTGVTGNEYNSSYWENGYVTKWNGIDTVGCPQAHRPGTEAFLLDDTKIYIFPMTMDKPIKATIGGEDFLSVTDGTENSSLQPTITYITQYGVGALVGTKFGMCDFA